MPLPALAATLCIVRRPIGLAQGAQRYRKTSCAPPFPPGSADELFDLSGLALVLVIRVRVRAVDALLAKASPLPDQVVHRALKGCDALVHLARLYVG
jgi:hypothetical protein